VDQNDRSNISFSSGQQRISSLSVLVGIIRHIDFLRPQYDAELFVAIA